MNDTATTAIRVVQRVKIGSDVIEKPVWTGDDVDELSVEHPPSDIFGADSLGRTEIEDGYIITTYRFERQAKDGSWEEIDDPRRRLTPMTELEEAIEAENRRYFPGDFLDVCQDCGRDPCECDEDRMDNYERPPEYCADCKMEVVYDHTDHDREICAICNRCSVGCNCD